ncbi:Rib/alpha-like domain-containing protein [Lactobacillus sp. PV034]|uniref:Rib/alpha-like domain-containing protein n=1 Tax=Lactobacillus sp. PV034 TaxID=2594495 RepID=UPI002240B990|nr:Rib/alpha-like domain-containing protein [Lactobacillus sp. PV034]QNQ81509.1 LPXTG cell wall anchor domain-containing protein [Lactobacillus sp. PV034]
MKKLSTKKNKLFMGLGALALVATLGLTSQSVKAADTNDQAKVDQDQLNAHKDLQAYNYPLTAQELTTTVGELPSAEAGVANWSSLPAGTTAVWNMNPDISKAGMSYGQIIVTFPDGSASALAVDVKTTDSAAVKDESQAASEDSVTSNDEDSTQAASDTSNVSEPVTVSDVKQNKVIEKDGANAPEAVAPKTEAAVIENEASHVEGDGALPQTGSKNVIVTLISGMMLVLASLGLFAVKERN